jgi:hypothetical protein
MAKRDTSAISAHTATGQQDGTRATALRATTLEQIQDLDSAQVSQVKAILRHGPDPGVWETPREWNARATKMQRFSIRDRIIDHLPADLRKRLSEQDAAAANVSADGSRARAAVDKAILALERYMILCRVGPSGIGMRKSFKSLDVTTIWCFGYTYAPSWLAIGITNLLEASESEADGRVFSRIELSDLDKVTASCRKTVMLEIERMRRLSDLGLWADCPSFTPPLRQNTRLKGRAKPASLKAAQSREYQPIPDDYLSEMGRKSLWIMQELGANLVRLLPCLATIVAEARDQPLSKAARREQENDAVGARLANFDWKDSNGEPIVQLPFPIKLSTMDAGLTGLPVEERASHAQARSAMWPPRNLAQIKGLVATVQKAHVFIVLLSDAGRHGETMDLGRDCISRARNGLSYANGRTFKLVERKDGEQRDWVLPDVGCEAIDRQEQLLRAAESFAQILDGAELSKATPRHLWFEAGSMTTVDFSKALGALHYQLLSYADDLRMTRKPGGENLHPHRFRKSVARLCALALTEAPKVLQDVFGHRNIEMTLYYILTDKSLAAEVEQIARELRVMRAREVVEAMVADEDVVTAQVLSKPLGGFGGPAALPISRAVHGRLREAHRRGEEWGAEDGFELAQLLTVGGSAWRMPRPGVMCTKLPGEAGPCTKSRGEPDASKCRVDCGHRLEDALFRSEVDASIGTLVSFFHRTSEERDLLTRAAVAEQIRQEVPRFSDLELKWRHDPVVVQAMENSI